MLPSSHWVVTLVATHPLDIFSNHSKEPKVCCFLLKGLLLAWCYRMISLLLIWLPNDLHLWSFRGLGSLGPISGLKVCPPFFLTLYIVRWENPFSWRTLFGKGSHFGRWPFWAFFPQEMCSSLGGRPLWIAPPLFSTGMWVPPEVGGDSPF